MHVQSYTQSAATPFLISAFAHDVGHFTDLARAPDGSLNTTETPDIEVVIRTMRQRAETITGGLMSMLARRRELQDAQKMGQTASCTSPLAWIIEKVKCVFGCRTDLGVPVPANLAVSEAGKDDIVRAGSKFYLDTSNLSDVAFEREIISLKQLDHIESVLLIFKWYDSDFDDEEGHLRFRIDKILEILSDIKIDTLILYGINPDARQKGIVERISQIQKCLNLVIEFGEHSSSVRYQIVGFGQYSVSYLND